METAKTTVVPGLNIQTVTHGKLTWVDIVQPTVKEIDYLRENYPFHPLDLDDTLSKIQRPKIDEYDDYLFMVLHFPVFNKATRVTVPSEVDIFIGENYVITLHAGNLKPLVQLFNRCKNEETGRKEHMGRSSGFLLYQIIDRLVDYCFPILNKIISNVERVEDRVFEEKLRETVQEISMLRRDIITFRRIIKPQVVVVASLEHKERPFLKEELEVYFGNITDHIGKILDALDDYREVIETLNDTHNALTSHKINDVMRVLTIISTIMLPLSVLSGLYGMNISLPLADSQFAFGFVVLIMAFVAGGMLVFFQKRGWI